MHFLNWYVHKDLKIWDNRYEWNNRSTPNIRLFSVRWFMVAHIMIGAIHRYSYCVWIDCALWNLRMWVRWLQYGLIIWRLIFWLLCEAETGCRTALLQAFPQLSLWGILWLLLLGYLFFKSWGTYVTTVVESKIILALLTFT